MNASANMEIYFYTYIIQTQTHLSQPSSPNREQMKKEKRKIMNERAG